jgi:hypothetical protein
LGAEQAGVRDENEVTQRLRQVNCIKEQAIARLCQDMRVCVLEVLRAVNVENLWKICGCKTDGIPQL